MIVGVAEVLNRVAVALLRRLNKIEDKKLRTNCGII